MPAFLNPYHFVPTGKEQSRTGTLAEFERGTDPAMAAVTHSRFVPGTHSGRLVYSVRTVTPTVVGGLRDEAAGELPVVRPFTLDGQPAVPGSSMRGLISSVAEAASNSALRVLEDRRYSRRMSLDLRESLSAIGRTVRSASGQLCIEPLTLPTLTGAPGAWQVAPVWRKIFAQANLRAYITGEADIAAAKSAAVTAGVPRVKMSAAPSRGWPPGALADIGTPKRKVAGQSVFLLGQIASGLGVPSATAIEGHLMVLEPSSTVPLPDNKEYPLFIPDPAVGSSPLPIPPEVIRSFDDLAAHRHADDSSLPLRIRGCPAGPTLTEGELVFFDVDDSGRVCEVSRSSIWRRWVGPWKKAVPPRRSAFEFFRAVDAELLPMGPGRRTVTLAERLFGFVSRSDGNERKAGDPSPALKGRVRFSHARLSEPAPGGIYMERIPLKPLLSPKPPSPALYFEPDERGDARAKAELEVGKDHPKGRKFYLHQRPAGQWEAREVNAQRQASVTPLAQGNVFAGHVDFENLTDEELGLLCYAFAPCDGFMHKIGMGKAVGLGSVQIDVLGVCFIDRAARYSSEGYFAGRWSAIETGRALAEWPTRYAASVAARENTILDMGWLANRRGAFVATHPSADTASGDIGRSLQWLGVVHDQNVHWPIVAGQSLEAGENYKWFVLNERRHGPKQAMANLPAEDPTLTPNSS